MKMEINFSMIIDLNETKIAPVVFMRFTNETK